MTRKEVDEATVARGMWLYAQEIDETVRIVGLPFDYWYAIAKADDQLQEDEEPTALGAEGLLYYAYFANLEGAGFPTVIQAKGFAQSMVQSEIRWM